MRQRVSRSLPVHLRYRSCMSFPGASAPPPVLPTPPSTESVPNLVGRSAEDVRAVAAAHGWKVTENLVEPGWKEQAEGSVASQFPKPGVAMTAGSVLMVDVVERGSSKSGPSLVMVLLAAAVGLLLGLGSMWALTGSTRSELEEANADLAATEALLAQVGEVGPEMIGELNDQIATRDATIAELTLDLEAATIERDALIEVQTELSADLTASEALVAEQQVALDAAEQEVASLTAQLEAVAGKVFSLVDLNGLTPVQVREYASVSGVEVVFVGEEVEGAAVAVQSPAPGHPMVGGSVVAVTLEVPAPPEG
jgi:hypothetical protein